MNYFPKDIRRFIYGQHFSDGLRTTLLICLPAVVASTFGYFDMGLTVAIGAMCVGISDTPGPAYHKRNAMLACCVFTFVISLLTGFLRMNVYSMGAGLTLLAFFFAMFTMYGARASLVGTSILLLMVLEMDKELKPLQILENSALLTAGAIWYSAVSLLILALYPYRAAQRALGECIRETASYLALRRLLYDMDTPVEEAFKKLLAQQVVLNDKQSEVRDLLFKNKKIMVQKDQKARAMILTFDEVIDLYEKISASHIDYEAIRTRYAKTDVLQDVRITLYKLSEMLDHAGAAVQYDRALKETTDVDIAISALTDTITTIINEEERPVLDKLLTNIQNMYKVVKDLQHYFTDQYPVLNSNNDSLDHSLFVTHQTLDLKLVRYNMSFDSLTFRHSVRMGLACLIGFILSKGVLHGHHSYWLLITIIFVLKPAFSLTRERNNQRILGTVIGGVIGVFILLYVHDTRILFAFMVIAMLFTYSFQRHKYLIAVVFMTPYLLILFHFMHVGLMEVAEERIVDTIVGSIIALVAGYLILPDWESAQIKGNMIHMLDANYRYLGAIRDMLKGAMLSVTDYKLIRKEVYVSTSNLSAALQRMNSEPMRTRRNTNEIEKFALLNHQLTSNIAAAKETIHTGTDVSSLAWTERSISVLQQAIKAIDEKRNDAAPSAESKSLNGNELKDPFETIYETSTGIAQITQAISF